MVDETDVSGRGPTRGGRSVISITILFPHVFGSCDMPSEVGVGTVIHYAATEDRDVDGIPMYGGHSCHRRRDEKGKDEDC